MNHSPEVQDLLSFAGLRLLNLKDWLNHHPLPPDYIVNLTLHPRTQAGHESLGLRLKFPTYREALDWGHRNCRFTDGQQGFDQAKTHETFLSIPMADFTLTLAFPEETHPRFFPALNGTSKTLSQTK